jgi:hypothetical protein
MTIACPVLFNLAEPLLREVERTPAERIAMSFSLF